MCVALTRNTVQHITTRSHTAVIRVGYDYMGRHVYKEIETFTPSDSDNTPMNSEISKETRSSVSRSELCMIGKY